MKVILLDIDGVLSPTYSTQEDSLIVDIQWSKFKIPVRVAEFIRNVSYEVEIIWASSWEYDSLEVSKELNLKIKQVIEFGDTESVWFKIPSYLQYLKENEDKEVLIIDDEICEFKEHFASFPNVTLICPDDRIGLADKDFEAVLEWMNL